MSIRDLRFAAPLSTSVTCARDRWLFPPRQPHERPRPNEYEKCCGTADLLSIKRDRNNPGALYRCRVCHGITDVGLFDTNPSPATAPTKEDTMATSPESTTAYDNYLPSVGQTRRDKLDNLFDVIDDDLDADPKGSFTVRYANGRESVIRPGTLASLSEYVSGPSERNSDVVIANRVERALRQCPAGLDKDIASTALHCGYLGTASTFCVPALTDPAILKAVLDTVDVYVNALPAKQEESKRNEVRHTFVSESIDSVAATFGAIQKAAEKATAERDAADKARLDDLATKPYRVGTYPKSATTSDVASLDAALKHLSDHGVLRVSQADARAMFGITDAAPHPLHVKASAEVTADKAAAFNARVDAAVATLEYLLRREGWTSFAWRKNGTACPYPQTDTLMIEVTQPGSNGARRDALITNYVGDLARLDAILLMLDGLISNACHRWIKLCAKVTAANESKVEPTADAPGRVLSMTLGSTIPDRDTLAQDYIKARGVLGTSPGEIVRDAYAYADIVIRHHVTCIVGIEHKDAVLLAADSMTSNHYSADVASVAKLFRVGEYSFGFTSSWRMGDLLRYHLALPDPPTKDLRRHLVTVAIPAIRACLKEGGFATVTNGVETGGSFLLAVGGKLFQIDNDFQVARSSHGYAAVGSGAMVALGALSATVGVEPKARAKAALLAAERHTCHVRRPWRFLSTTTETA